MFRPPTFPEVPKGRFKSQVRAGKRCRDQGGAAQKQPAPGGSPTASAESSCRTKTPPGWRKVTGLSTDSRAPPATSHQALHPPPIKEVRFRSASCPPCLAPTINLLGLSGLLRLHLVSRRDLWLRSAGRRPSAGCLASAHGLTHVLREEGGRPGSPWRRQTGHRQEPRNQGSLLWKGGNERHDGSATGAGDAAAEGRCAGSGQRGGRAGPRNTSCSFPDQVTAPNQEGGLTAPAGWAPSPGDRC